MRGRDEETHGSAPPAVAPSHAFPVARSLRDHFSGIVLEALCHAASSGFARGTPQPCPHDPGMNSPASPAHVAPSDTRGTAAPCRAANPGKICPRRFQEGLQPASSAHTASSARHLGIVLEALCHAASSGFARGTPQPCPHDPGMNSPACPAHVAPSDTRGTAAPSLECQSRKNLSQKAPRRAPTRPFCPYGLICLSFRHRAGSLVPCGFQRFRTSGSTPLSTESRDICHVRSDTPWHSLHHRCIPQIAPHDGRAERGKVAKCMHAGPLPGDMSAHPGASHRNRKGSPCTVFHMPGRGCPFRSDGTCTQQRDSSVKSFLGAPARDMKITQKMQVIDFIDIA